MNNLRKIIIAVVALIIIISVSAGVYLYKINSKKPEQVVREYNQSLLKAYRNLNFKGVSKYVTMEQYYEDLDEIEGMKKDKTYMEAKITREKVAFKEVKNKNARVKMSENWTYRLVSTENKKVVNPDRDVMYIMTYYLKKDLFKGWRITRTESISYDLGYKK